jgi:hypothetical protein
MTVTRFDLQHRRAVRKERRWDARRKAAWGKSQPITGNRLIALLRVSELSVVFKDRWGVTLPDDDAGRDDLRLLFHHLAATGGDVTTKMVGHANRWAPWLPAPQARRLANEVAARPMKFHADTLAHRLRLTYKDRRRLKVRTIGCIEMTAEQRRAFKKEDDVLARKKKRRERGVRSRAEYEAKSDNRLKPWLAEGVSRRTWYRRQAKSKGGTSVTAIYAQHLTAVRLVSLTQCHSPSVTLMKVGGTGLLKARVPLNPEREQ